MVAWMLYGPDTRSLEEFIDPSNGQITRDDNAPGKPITGVSIHRRFDNECRPHDFFAFNYFAFHDSDLAAMRPRLESLSELRELDLVGTEITDQGLRHLKGLTHLKTLRVGSSRSIASTLTKDAVLELQKDLPDTTICFYKQFSGFYEVDGTLEEVCDHESPPPARQSAVPTKGSKPAAKNEQSVAKKEIAFSLGPGVSLELVLIPAGEFLMGSPAADEAAFMAEQPQHRVRITRPFYLGKYKVTLQQWKAVMGDKPSRYNSPKDPVDMVSFDRCLEFITKLNSKVAADMGRFALPTEAQWEYACRAGSTTRYCFGDDLAKLGEYAWYDKNSDFHTSIPVGQKKPNAWGLYDMHGRVGEWCADLYGPYTASPVDDPTGPSLGWGRVQRGGSIWHHSRYFRSAQRASVERTEYGSDNGLRVAFLPAED